MIKQEENSWDVVLAEDDKDDVLIFELAVERARILINLRHAVDGDELFRLLKESIPDIIFLDINMPCKDGITCIAEIRQNPEYNHVPVIMYTSYNHSQRVEAAYKNGANFYLLKNESIVELAENLKRIFTVEWKRYMYYPPINQFIVGN
jgi:CheY-like chemotaxis protein